MITHIIQAPRAVGKTTYVELLVETLGFVVFSRDPDRFGGVSRLEKLYKGKDLIVDEPHESLIPRIIRLAKLSGANSLTLICTFKGDIPAQLREDVVTSYWGEEQNLCLRGNHKSINNS